MKMLKRISVMTVAASLAASLAGCDVLNPAGTGNQDDKQDQGQDQTSNSVHAGEITKNETWTKADSPHRVTADVYVQGAATLTIEPGAVVKFDSGTGLYVGYSSETGYLKAVGTAEEGGQITFTTSLPNPAKGSWAGLWIENGGGSSVLDHVKIEYAGKVDGSLGAALRLHGAQAQPTLTNTTISHSQGHGVYADYGAGFTKFEQNTITRSDESPLRIDAAQVGTMGALNELTGNASGRDYIEVNAGGSEITQAATWRDQGVPYRVTGDGLYIGKNTGDAVLTLDPGVELQFAQGTGVYVGYSEKGALRALGTSQKPVVFRSLPGNENAGVWEGVIFFGYAVDGDAGNAKSSKLEHVFIKYGGEDAKSSGYGALHFEDATALLSNVTIVKSTVGLKLTSSGTNEGFPVVQSLEGVPDLTGELANITFVEMAAADRVFEDRAE